MVTTHLHKEDTVTEVAMANLMEVMAATEVATVTKVAIDSRTTNKIETNHKVNKEVVLMMIELYL